MSDINLYRILEIDSRATCSDIPQRTKGRISNLDQHSAKYRESQLAVSILSDPYLRETYDSALQDVTAPEITWDALEQLSHLRTRASKPQDPSHPPGETQEKRSNYIDRRKAPLLLVSFIGVVALLSAFFFVQMIYDADGVKESRPTEPDCGSTDAEEQLHLNYKYIALEDSWEGENHWSPNNAITDTFDKCAELSWIDLPSDLGSVSTPHQIMLFHKGEYVGTATEKAHYFTPEINRVTDNEISVTWTWARDGEPMSDASGRTTAQFFWSEDEEMVSRIGDEPPRNDK